MSNLGGEHSKDELWVCQLGTVPYREAVAIQEHVRERRLAGELPDTLLLLEHPPVYTRGRRSADGELPLGEDFYRAHGIEVIATDRGGRITYHGPGQLVGYPIMRIEAIDRYLRTMEDAIVAALAEEGIDARARPEDGPRLHRRVGRGSARSPRSACTSRAGSPRTASRSTWRTTSSRSRGSSPAACPT